MTGLPELPYMGPLPSRRTIVGESTGMAVTTPQPLVSLLRRGLGLVGHTMQDELEDLKDQERACSVHGEERAHQGYDAKRVREG